MDKNLERCVNFWNVQTKRIEIFDSICDERQRQDEKWGVQNHIPSDWCMILGEEIGEVNKAALEAKFAGKSIEEYRKELIQSAAVIFAMIECLDRNSN